MNSKIDFEGLKEKNIVIYDTKGVISKECVHGRLKIFTLDIIENKHFCSKYSYTSFPGSNNIS